MLDPPAVLFHPFHDVAPVLPREQEPLTVVALGAECCVHFTLKSDANFHHLGHAACPRDTLCMYSFAMRFLSSSDSSRESVDPPKLRSTRGGCRSPGVINSTRLMPPRSKYSTAFTSGHRGP